MSFKDIGFSKVDLDRQTIKGFPEIVYGLHKSAEQILKISQTLYEHNGNVLITRFSKEKWEQIKTALPAGDYDPIGQTFVAGSNPFFKKGKVLVLSAGTSDDFVVYEAVNTLKWMGCHVEMIQDVGVAGLGRLLSYIDRLREASVLIVVAGMEGALPSVVSGLVDVPVIAVPTSVGYGTNLEGLTTVLAMLTSCSSGISVVNIDNGFGAAYQAALTIKLINKEVD
ncbi:MAG: nickel pincer cofactor biosynthesis protein LarB [Aerococcaceae bacterium]|nr:nickel pincer cofactor biosynthesis protein LarB [Aerococcaceae bacterium]